MILVEERACVFEANQLLWVCLVSTVENVLSMHATLHDKLTNIVAKGSPNKLDQILYFLYSFLPYSTQSCTNE